METWARRPEGDQAVGRGFEGRLSRAQNKRIEICEDTVSQYPTPDNVWMRVFKHTGLSMERSKRKIRSRTYCVFTTINGSPRPLQKILGS